MRKTKHNHLEFSFETGLRMDGEHHTVNYTGRAAGDIGQSARYFADRPEMRENKGDITC